MLNPLIGSRARSGGVLIYYVSCSESLDCSLIRGLSLYSFGAALSVVSGVITAAEKRVTKRTNLQHAKRVDL